MTAVAGKQIQADRVRRAPGHAQLPVGKLRTYLGRPEVVAAIHGGVIPEERRVIQERVGVG
jgi:hypothetical protein